jgi:exonuclease SbcC
LGWTLAIVAGRGRLRDGEPCALCGAREHDLDAAPHEPELEARIAAADARLVAARRRMTEATTVERRAATAAAETRVSSASCAESGERAADARAAALSGLRDALELAEPPESSSPRTVRDAEAETSLQCRDASSALDSLEAARQRSAVAHERLEGARERARSTGEVARAAQMSLAAAEATLTKTRRHSERRAADRARLDATRDEAISAVRAATAEHPTDGAVTLALFAVVARPGPLDLDAMAAEVDAQLHRRREEEEAARRGVAAREATLAAATSAQAACKQRLEKLSERLFHREDLLLKALEALDLPDAAALLARRLPPAEAERLRVERNRLAEAAARASTVLAERATALQEHDERAPGGVDAEDVTVESLADAIGGFEQRIDQLQKELADLRSTLDLDDDHRRRHRDLLAEERRARARAEVWQRLHRLIGVGDGQAFKNFAQILNLNELIEKANHHLARLSDRYRLTPALDDDGRPRLSFAVMDRYQADEQRPLTTLSGGETFLVSLSLALALADFRTVRMPIETLLLDEGFGTLDHATLDIAMNALSRLQAGGTQVGILSHVEALKARIPAQVLVEPVGDGRSIVRIRTTDVVP